MVAVEVVSAAVVVEGTAGIVVGTVVVTDVLEAASGAVVETAGSEAVETAGLEAVGIELAAAPCVVKEGEFINIFFM